MGEGTPSRAEIKGALAAAYAAGQQPEFVTVLPDRSNELWSLAGVAFVMPIVAPDAPDSLQFALRLRRETLMTGTCPHCRATVDVQVRGQFAGIDAGTAFFAHAARCPAEDNNVQRQVHDHLARRGAKDMEDWYRSANQQTRQRIDPWKGAANEIVTVEGRSRAEEILDAELDLEAGVETCPHLAVTPAQTWICLIGEGVWRCEQCWEYRAADVAKRLKRGEPGPLDWIQDHSCDLCGTIYPTGLRPLLLRIDQFVMHGATCRRCSERHGSDSSIVSDGHGERTLETGNRTSATDLEEGEP